MDVNPYILKKLQGKKVKLSPEQSELVLKIAEEASNLPVHFNKGLKEDFLTLSKVRAEYFNCNSEVRCRIQYKQANRISLN